MADPTSNIPEQTVSELSGALKRTIEDRFGYVRVRGEISGYRGPHASGHAYFGLKDATAKIDAVIWKGTFGRLRIKPSEGLEVIATGKITTFPGKSSYQIVIDTIEPAGVGALMALLEDRRRRLIAEGLFDDNRKQLIPFLPKIIGVVTSPTGSVIKDILHRLEERFPRHVLVWPVRVQGETCAAEVAQAITGFNQLPENGPIPRPDLIIVARGGGSLEDLWGFNEEIVVRAAAASMIPLISAIGHETDTTLLDFAADLRAPTPTAAAEKAVPVRHELRAAVGMLNLRMLGGQARRQEQRRSDLRNLLRAMPRADDFLAAKRQSLDRSVERLTGNMTNLHTMRRMKLIAVAHRLASQSPQARMARASQQLDNAQQRLRRAVLVAQQRRAEHINTRSQRLQAALTTRARLAAERSNAARLRLNDLGLRLPRALLAARAQHTQRLAGLGQVLMSMDYHNVLARGFAIVRNGSGKMIRSGAELNAGARIEIEFSQNRIGAKVDGQGDAGPTRAAALKLAQGQLL